MKAEPCPREGEVAELSMCGAWPARADAGLRAHAAHCPSCQQMAAVVTALAATSEAETRSPRLPDARLVWHRAQMTAQREAARRAARPLVLIEIAAAAIVTLLLIVWAGNLSGGFARAWTGAGVWLASAGSLMEPVREAFRFPGPGNGQGESPLPAGYVILGLATLAVVVSALAAGLSKLADRSDS